MSLIAALTQLVGPGDIFTGLEDRRFYSTDLYSEGALCAAAVRPRDSETLARVVSAATEAGHAVVPRGGGLTYVGGYTPITEQTIVVDVSALNHILDISDDDMFITVEAGVTWKQIYEALTPRGLRLPFFGTFSGAQATVGGGLSNGALFLGTARYGTASEIVLGLEVALADGTLVRTGQAAFAGGRPFFRTYGPDLTGLFVHDAGALGVKTKATLRMIQTPSETDYLAFGFDTPEAAIAAGSEIARTQVAEEAYIMDPAGTKRAMAQGDLASNVKMVANVAREAGGGLKGAMAGVGVVRAGKHFADDVHSLNLVCAARSAAALKADKAEATEIATRFGGRRIPNSIPKTNRANLFLHPNGVVGPQGERWVALNAKVALSDGPRLYAAAEALLAQHREALDASGVRVSRLLTFMSNPAFSYEPVFTWFDSWLPQHRRAPEPGHLARLTEPKADPQTRALVGQVRGELVELFAKMGAASNQIGKTYRYLEALNPDTRALVVSLKSAVDPKGLMNPGALGL